MAINFGGGETSSFSCFNSTEITTVGTFKAPARCGVHTKKSGWMIADIGKNVSSQWFHFDVNVGLTSNNLTPIQIFSGTNTVVFSISTNGNVIVDGIPVGSINLFSSLGLRTIDIRLSTTGVTIYSNTRSVFSVSGSFTGLSNMRRIQFSPTGFDTTENTNTIWSQVIISDDATLGLELATLVLDNQGDLAQWGGTVNSINETILNSQTYINAPSVDLISTYTVTPLSAQYTEVKAVVVNALARYTGNGPQGLDAVLRSGGSNLSQAMTPLDLSYVPSHRVYATNPFNGLEWTAAQVNTTQFGFRSRN